MLPRRRCPFCRHWYRPHPRLKRRQQTCGRPECRRQQKQKSNQQWRAKNPDYFRGTYARQREKYGTRADYMRLYRQQHPDYVRSEEHTSELQSQSNLVCRLLLEKKKKLTLEQIKTTRNIAPIQSILHMNV